jgi:hypothetical protein
MDIKEGLVETDPGDIDQLASSQVKFSSESSNDTGKQILQELLPPTMATVYLLKPYKGNVSFDELIKTLQEPQLESLMFVFPPLDSFDEDQLDRNNSMREAFRNHRLQVLDVVSRCNSLKELRIRSTLDVDEMDVLCKNLVSHPALEILQLYAGNDQGVEMLCRMLQNNNNIKDLSVGDEGVEMLCQMLQNNHSIKTLTLGRIDAIKAASVGLMLGVNSTLEKFTLVGYIDGDTLKVLLRPLTCDDGNQLLNK